MEKKKCIPGTDKYSESTCREITKEECCNALFFDRSPYCNEIFKGNFTCSSIYHFSTFSQFKTKIKIN